MLTTNITTNVTTRPFFNFLRYLYYITIEIYRMKKQGKDGSTRRWEAAKEFFSTTNNMPHQQGDAIGWLPYNDEDWLGENPEKEERSSEMDLNDTVEGDPLACSAYRPHDSEMTVWRLYMNKIKNNEKVRLLLLVLVLFNTLILIFQENRYLALRYSWYSECFDTLCLGVYVWEECVRLGADRMGYFRENFLHFLIILVSFLAGMKLWFIEYITDADIAKNYLMIFSVFEDLRILRVMRYMRLVREGGVGVMFFDDRSPVTKARLVTVIVVALTSMQIFTLSGYVMYMDTLPQYFGTYGISFLTMFRVMTRGRWSEVAYANNNEAIILICSFVIIQSYFILSLVTAVVTVIAIRSEIMVNKRRELSKARNKEKTEDQKGAFYDRVRRTIIGGESAVRDNYRRRKDAEILWYLEAIEAMLFLWTRTKKLIEDLLDMPTKVLGYNILESNVTPGDQKNPCCCDCSDRCKCHIHCDCHMHCNCLKRCNRHSIEEIELHELDSNKVGDMSE